MFAELYSAHHDLHPEDLPFWIDLALQSPGPVLELGCGTGRVLIPAAAARRDSGRALAPVFGVDLDANMLRLLHRRLPENLAPSVDVFRSDFTRFRLARKFGLVMMPCNTYSTLDPGERRRVLQCVAACIEPGGVFAAAMPNPELLRSLPARSAEQVEEVFPHPLDGEPVQVSSGWRRTATLFSINWHYDHLLPDGRVERLSATVAHRLTAIKTYLEEMAAAGFVRPRLYADYDGVAYHRDASNFIFSVEAGRS